jgi:AraC family transcriptional regulator, transcriptional activator FtrA
LRDPHDLSSMAQRAHMSVRSLQRHFVQSTGLAPLAWLTRERVQLAKDLLETSAKPIPEIAERAGFGSEEVFRKHFKHVAGTTPTAYRMQFTKR